MRGVLIGLLLLVACGAEPQPIPDGLWRVTAIDGDPPTAEYLIRLRAGRVIGGVDGCSAWMFDMTQPPTPEGMRLVISDLTPCPSLPQRPAYWRALGNGNAVPAWMASGELRVQAGGSKLSARPLARDRMSGGRGRTGS